ncbi:hypothetical protein L4C54_16200 [Vibrio lamellibrachiae]|uniref:hypothetical protein n=1 Tax=Vibrio lamellibrachiae TaxID=2910253 RepID=UPI003D100FC5
MKRILSLLLIGFSTFYATACNFHGGFGLQIPSYPNLFTSISNIAVASASEVIPAFEKPEAMLNWQLAQKMGSTKPDLDITFYQAIEGHYSMISDASFRLFDNYPESRRPKAEDLMIMSEMSVFSAIVDQKITVDQALNEKWIVVNGEQEAVEMVKEWLLSSLY